MLIMTMFNVLFMLEQYFLLWCNFFVVLASECVFLFFFFQELQLAHNDISSLETFSLLSNSIKQRLSATVKQINLLGNNLAEIPASVAQVSNFLNNPYVYCENFKCD